MELLVISTIARLSLIASVTLFATVWQTALLAVVLAACLRFLPRCAPSLRYALWATLLPIVIALPFVSFVARHTVSYSAKPTLVHVNPHWSFVIAGLWLLLSLARGTKLLSSAVRLRAIAGEAIPIHPACLEPTALSTGNGRVAILCTSSAPEMTQPSVIDLRSPRIIIPVQMYESLSAVELQQIVLHEMEHLRRRDDWLNLVQKLALVLFPLNPALIWIERCLCRERELACDDGVLQTTASPKTYAACLVNLAEQRLYFRQMPLALGAWARRPELASRVERILDGSSIRVANRPQAMLVAGTLIAGFLGGSVALARGPRLVAFSPALETSAAAVVSMTDLPPQAITPSPAAAHMTLLKAEMPLHPSSGSFRPSHQMDHQTKSRRIQVVRHRLPRTPFVTLASWVIPARVVSVRAVPITFMIDGRSDFSSSTYTAVSTPGGWIVLQL